MINPMHEDNSNQSGKWRGPVLLTLAAMAISSWVIRKKIQQAERDHPPMGKFIEVDGIRLHYVEHGTGTPLVLLHGNGAMAEDFEISGLPEAAAAQHRVIIFDRPGYGYSDRPQDRKWTPLEQARLLHKASQQLGIDRPIVLGHSWGTLVAIAWALEFPEDVGGLVLLSGYYYPSMRPDTKLLATPALPIIGTLMRYTVSPLSSRLLWPAITKQIFRPAEVAERFRSFPVWLSLRPSQLRASAIESGMMVPSAKTLSKRYRELKMPILIMAGTKDKIANPKHNSERLHEELPHSLLWMKENVGHMIHYACPDEIVTAIQTLETMEQPDVPPTLLARPTGNGASVSPSIQAATHSDTDHRKTLH
ncbi:MAG TPA: alpha/beta hydrolase [Burkholderiaceae bacterium]|jgi:pimeloyl-ACP methyl ester carboxylesterase